MQKFEEWKQNLNHNTQEWLEYQPIWRDRDMALAAAIALFVGFIIGYYAA